MADILGLIKKFGLKGDAIEEVDDVARYGKNLKELALLDSLDKEYEEARNDLKDTHNKLKEIEETIIALDQEKKEKQQLSEQLYVEGRSFYDQGDYGRAIERWHHVLELNPQHKRSLAAIQDAKERITKEEKERLDRQSVVEKKSQEALEHFEIGKKYYREKNYEQAIEEFEMAINIGGRNPEIIEYRSLADQRIKEREEHIDREKKEKEEKERLIKEHCLLANNFYRQKKYEEAVQEWEKALILDPESRVLQENVRRGEAAFREYKKSLEEQAKEAEEKLRKIRELQLQGLKSAREHDYQKAIESWELALSLDPSREDLYHDIKSAQESYREMERLRLENEQKEKERLIREQEHERQRQAEADRLKQEREEREKERLRKEEELAKRQEEEKLARLEEERKARVEKMKAHYGRGLRFYKLQEFEKALTEWEIVVSLDPKFENVTDLMDQAGKRIDEIHRDEENRRKAVEEEKRRLEEEARKQKAEREKKVQDLFHEGMQLAYNEQYEKALEKMQQALSLSRDDRGIKDQILDIEKRILDARRKEEEERLLKEGKAKEEERKQLKIRLLSEQAQMYFEDGDYQRAMEEWRKILEVDFSNQEARTWMYKAERAIKDAQRKMMDAEKVRKEKKEMISRLGFEAVELFNDGHYEEAIKVWSQVFDMDPVNSDAKQGMIKAKQRIKEIQTREKAREMAKKLIHEQESRLNYLKKTIDKGERFYIDGDYKQALSEWEKALEELKG